VKAIVCRETLWDDPQPPSTNYLARALVRRGWEVLWLTRPWHPYALLMPRWRREKSAKLQQWISGGQLSDLNMVRSYSFGTLLPYRRLPLLGSAWVGRHTLDFSFPAVRPMLRRIGFENPDLLMVSDLAQVALLGCVSARRSVLHVTDDYLGFGRTPASGLEIERWAAVRADVIVTPRTNLANVLAERHGLEGDRLLVLPQGVEAEILESGPPPDDFRLIPKPRVVYVGTLRSWFDPHLVDRVVASCPDFSFAIVGAVPPTEAKVSRELTALGRHSNLYLLGAKPHTQAMACLASADAAILPFRVAPRGEDAGEELGIQRLRFAAPMKLIEYLAFGLPVITTLDYAADLQTPIESPVMTASDPDTFSAAVRVAVARGLSDRVALREAGHAFVRHNTWDRRLDRLLTHLGLQST
jgi:glycosyltransferase involved in cell wall biosynthesis